MAWTIPDKGEGDNDTQSILFQEYLDVLLAGIGGEDCVLAGCEITGGADMTPAVAKGAVLTDGMLKPVTAGDVTITAADGTHPRIDLIVVDSSGAKQVRAGTPAAAPKPPTRTTNDVVLASVYVPANDTSIESTKITDLRVVRVHGPLIVYKTVTAETTNTTTAVINALAKAAGGLTIPNGLFLAGKTLRVRLGGNMLLNSGTATVRLIVVYGGTTMFSDISAASVNSATRRAWWVDFDLMAQGNADQTLSGSVQMNDPTIAPVAPTTGVGDAWGLNTAAQETQTAIGGSAAVDSDAADRLLQVQIQFNVSNAAVELVVESATVELI